jgi:hypothetical protein
MEDLGIFYGRLVFLTPLGGFNGLLEHFGISFHFWPPVPRKIWQP